MCALTVHPFKLNPFPRCEDLSSDHATKTDAVEVEVEAHTCDPSTWEVEAGRPEAESASLGFTGSSRPSWAKQDQVSNKTSADSAWLLTSGLGKQRQEDHQKV